MNHNTCPECGKAFPQSEKGQTKVYCSRSCSRKAGHKRRSPECKCLNCGIDFRPKVKDRITYCSRECSFEHKRAKPKEHIATVYDITCKICNANFQSKRLGVFYCSAECRAKKKKETNYYKPVSHPSVDNICVTCGGVFTVTRHVNKKYCSLKCSRKTAKLTRRARKRKQYVAPVYRNEIILRDKGICQLCGKKVDLTLSTTHPMSATIDHIIPLAKGGAHEPGNVQLAHFSCNVAKRDKIIEHQLAFF